MRVLLTGFTPFDTHDLNPSQLIVDALGKRLYPEIDLIVEVLPVVYRAAGARVAELIAQHQPDVVLCLGLAAKRKAIHLERVALNLNDAKIPDNDGDLAMGRPIEPGGPAAYWSTLPLETMRQMLEARAIPVEISNHAGAYVCNHVFYAARHAIEQNAYPTRCGFIHVPAIAPDTDVPGLALSTLIEAVEVCLLAACRIALEQQPDRSM